LQIVQIIASFMQKRRLRDTTGDPWDGRTLEWSTASAPQFYNYTTIPKVSTRDEFWEMKQRGLPKPAYEDIHIPYNTGTGIYIAVFAFLACFGFVWEIVWLVVVSLIGIIVIAVARTFNDKLEYTLTADEVKKMEAEREKKLEAEQKPQTPLSHLNIKDEEDMGLIEFIKIVIRFGLDVIKNKRWQTWK